MIKKSINSDEAKIKNFIVECRMNAKPNQNNNNIVIMNGNLTKRTRRAKENIFKDAKKDSNIQSPPLTKRGQASSSKHRTVVIYETVPMQKKRFTEKSHSLKVKKYLFMKFSNLLQKKHLRGKKR